MYAFSSMHVNDPHASSGNSQSRVPISTSSELALALDISKSSGLGDGEPSISVEDPSPVAHEHQMQTKLQGAAVTGYPENFGYYANSYTESFCYPVTTGYDLNQESIDATPTARTTPSVPYQYYP